MISEHTTKKKLSEVVEPETYPGSYTFVNSYDIRSQREFSRVEAAASAFRAGEYRLAPIDGDFDLFHLQIVHHHLFQDVYSWAGHCRAYDMRKGANYFCPARDIKKYSSQLYGGLRDEKWLVDLSWNQFISRIAFYYSLTNKLHPFPEGNGRAQRLFFEHLAALSSYRISWKDAVLWQVNEAAAQSFLGRLEPTIYMFEDIIEPMKVE